MSNEEDATPKVDPAQEAAMARGWRPQEEWEGDPSEWVDAGTFNRMGELMDRISSQSKELKEVKSVISEFKEHNKNRDKIALKKAKEQLLAEKASAMENEDFNRVVQIDEDLKATDKEIENADKPDPNSTGRDPFKAYYEDVWVKDNGWYKNSVVLRGAADTLGEEFYRENPSASPEEMFSYVTKEIKREFPDKFKNPDREKPPAVGSNSSGGKKGRKAQVNLTDEEYDVGMRFVKTGLYESIEEYAAELNDK